MTAARIGLVSVLALVLVHAAQAQQLSSSPAGDRQNVVRAASRAPRAQSLLVSNRPIFDPDGNQAGYRQEIRVVAPHKAGPANAGPIGAAAVAENQAVRDAQSWPSGRGGCAGEATVAVLAHELTYGSVGSVIPTRVDFQLGGGAALPMFGGADVLVCMQQVISLTPGEELRLTVRGLRQ